MTSAYSKAVSMGYPWATCEGRPSHCGRFWMNSFARSRRDREQGRGGRLFVGYDQAEKRWVFEWEEAR